MLSGTKPYTQKMANSVSSDGVLNPSGVRFGSSEIYAILDRRFGKEIVDSLCVGRQRESDVTELVFLFVKLSPEFQGKLQAVRTAVRQAIGEDLSRRHVPAFILDVDAIPYNGNGKKLEIPVKKILSWGTGAMDSLRVSPAEKVVLETYRKYADIEYAAAGGPKLDKPRL